VPFSRTRRSGRPVLPPMSFSDLASLDSCHTLIWRLHLHWSLNNPSLVLPSAVRPTQSCQQRHRKHHPARSMRQPLRQLPQRSAKMQVVQTLQLGTMSRNIQDSHTSWKCQDFFLKKVLEVKA